MPAYEVIIRGRVQGVGYRAFTQASAHSLGVTGWVRNEPEGSVRALLQHSDPAAVEQFMRLLAQGPAAAAVKGIEISIIDEHQPQAGFEILP